MSGPAEDCTAWLGRALAEAVPGDVPFRHWTVRAVLPPAVAAAVPVLPFSPPDMEAIAGRRESVNAQRSFFSAENRARFAVCEAVAQAFQAPATVALIERTCAATLAGSYLRIEHALDTDGFWLEPHTDIGAKLFTMLVYLSTHPDAEGWGTDLFHPDGTLAVRGSGAFNTALVFIPGADTFHGFVRRPIAGVRHSLIVNYVIPAWRSRHELAFPQQPVG